MFKIWTIEKQIHTRHAAIIRLSIFCKDFQKTNTPTRKSKTNPKASLNKGSAEPEKNNYKK